MTIAQQIGRAAIDLDRSERVDLFFESVRYLMQGAAGANGNALTLARAARAPDRVIEYVQKAATSAATTTDPTFASALAPHSLAAGFVASLVGQSIFDTVRGSTLQVPPRTSVISVSTGFSGSTIAEGNVKPLTRLSVGASDIDPVKAIAFCAMSAELVRMGGTLADNIIRKELTSATIRATDQQFLSLISAGGVTSFTASGVTSTAIRTDVALLLQNVASGSASRLFLLVPPTVAKGWSSVPEGGAPVFPLMSYRGGQVSGIDVVVSEQIASSEYWLIDASAIATATDGDVRLDATQRASLHLDAPGDSPPSASTVMTSLWQNNLIGIRAERWFAAKLLRSTAIAKITGVAYSGNSPS